MKLIELGFFFLRAVHKPFTLDCNRKVRPPSVDRPSEALYTAYIHAGKNGRFWPSSVSVDVYRKYVSKNYQWTCHHLVHLKDEKCRTWGPVQSSRTCCKNGPFWPLLVSTEVDQKYISEYYQCSGSNFFFFFFLEWQGFGFIINWDRCGQGVLPINCTPHISATLYLPCQITQDRNSMGSMWGFESFP